MPELPEVAGLAEFLDDHLRGASVTKVQIVSFAVLKTADPPFNALEGRTVTGVRRFGKFVSIDTGGISLVFHLARAGWVRFTDSPTDAQLRMGKGHIAARFTFAGPDGARGIDLTEAGTKKSLAVHVVRDPQEVPGIATLGPDPFTEAFDADMLAEILGASSQQIKGLLRSQSVIAGIGNAYSDEILHAARLSPFKMADKLTDAELVRLFDAVRAVLTEALDRQQGQRAATMKGEKRSGLQVHARTGLPCPVCGDTVREVSFADTSLQYCATCQTGGKPLADRRMSKLLR